eukprot:9179299-Pyramimonas_sp.AAC.1
MFFDFSDGEPTAEWDTCGAKSGKCELLLHDVKIMVQQKTQVDGELGTGSVVWDSGPALAEYVAVTPPWNSLHGKRVLELSAGVGGLPGISAVLGGTFAPPEPYQVAHAVHSIEHATTAFIELDWENIDDAALLAGKFDIILAADVIFGNVSTRKIKRFIRSRACRPLVFYSLTNSSAWAAERTTAVAVPRSAV